MVNVAWVVLHCNRRIGARERRQLIPHVRFQVPFLGPESQLKSGFVCAGLLCSNSICLLLTKRSCHFLFVARVVPPDLCCCFAVRFCGLIGTVFGFEFLDFAVIFGTARRSQKWDRESAFLLFFYFAVHRPVPKMGPPGGPIFGTLCLGSFFEVFCIKVAEAERFGFNEALWLHGSLTSGTGRATREALLSEAGFEKLFRTQNWVRRSKLFCR